MKILSISWCWKLLLQEQLYNKGSSRGFQTEVHMLPWHLLEERCLQVEGGDPFTSAQQWWDTSGPLCPIRSWPVRERYEQWRVQESGMSPAENHWNTEGLEHLTYKDRDGTICAGEKRSQRNLINVYKKLMGGVKKAEINIPCRWTVIGKEATGTNWNLENSA